MNMDDDRPQSPLKAALTGLAGGGGVGLALNAVGWALLLITALMFATFLLACMGMADMMSVNNTSWSNLLLALPETFFSLFGEFFAMLAGAGSVVGGLVCVACLGLGALIGVIVGRLRAPT